MSRPARRLAVSALAVGVGIAVLSGHGGAATSSGTPPKAAARAIAYARQQLGKPYLWGGTGPYAFDCSGLVMMAYRSAGIGIARTSQAQWATERHVSRPRQGDLVFYPGADGTWSNPGHVGLVTGPNRMIQAYAPGTPIGTYPYGVPAALAGTGPGTVIGYTRPWKTAA